MCRRLVRGIKEGWSVIDIVRDSQTDTSCIIHDPVQVCVSIWACVRVRASIVAERSEARKPFEKRFSDLNSVGPKTPIFAQKFLIGTTSGDDVITTDKTSKAPAAFT